MVRIWILLIALTADLSLAQSPATQPQAGERPPLNVLLLRFDQLDQTAGMQWVGRAVQQNLLAEAVRLRALQPITPKDETLAAHSTTDQTAAQSMGKDAGADYVVFGSYQNLDSEIRLTGSILDVATGKVIGGLKATGAVRDLFNLQDQIADQMKRQMLGLYAPPATQPTVALPPAPPLQASGPVQAPAPAPGSQFEGSWLERSLGYRGSFYETFKSPRQQNVYNNYYYSYPSYPYYGGWPYYYYTPFWGVGRRLPAKMQH